MLRNKNLSNSISHFVDVIPLDEIVNQHGITSIRLIKIDVEGFELDVFQGSTHVLSTIKPDAIIFELNEVEELSFYDKPLIKFLINFGYDLFEIQKSIFKVKLVKLDAESGYNPTGHDFLASPKGSKSDNIFKLT